MTANTEIFTPEGRALAEDMAKRHQVSMGAVEVLLLALERGGGNQAQFSHPDLGGFGQWSRGGMIMIGDMFNTALKARVDQLCNELSGALSQKNVLKSEAYQGSPIGGSWWPSELGSPSSSGSQDDMSYAYFDNSNRLAIRSGGAIALYDTAEHRISGVSQQQSGTGDLEFTSQLGPVRIHELRRLGKPSSAAPASEKAPPEAEPDAQKGSDEEIFAKIERLHILQQKGILSETEFAEKKKELLARI